MVSSLSPGIGSMSHNLRVRLAVAPSPRAEGSLPAPVAVRSGDGCSGSSRALRSKRAHDSKLELGSYRDARECASERPGRRRSALFHIRFRHLGSHEPVRWRGDAASGPRFQSELSLDVGIQTPGGLNLTSRTLSLAGSANLHVRGTAAQPVLLGRLNLSGGDLIFSGNRYKLQGGTIDFTNRSRTQPVVDMAVNTTIDQYDIQMHFWGPADHLHTNYASDPSLPPSDIINLIAFGKTSEAAAANPTPPGALGAQSLIASQVSSQITNRVEKLAGISQLSVDPVLGSSSTEPGGTGSHPAKGNQQDIRDFLPRTSPQPNARSSSSNIR